MAAISKVSGGIFSDIITWVRRIIKSASSSEISDATIADYINRFMTYDLPERIQLMEFKRQYTFETTANVFEYMVPFFPSTPATFPYNSNPPPFNQSTTGVPSQTPVPVYQTFRPPAYCDGVTMGWYQSNDQFYNQFPEYVNNEVPVLGDGTIGPYTVTAGTAPILRAYIDDIGNLKPYVFITAQNDNGNVQYIVDSGSLDANGLGILIQTDSTFQNITGPLPVDGGSGTVDYSTGEMTFTFLSAVSDQANIQVQTSPFSPGFPRVVLFFNNTFKLFPVPDRAYKIQIDCNITPSVFFQTDSAIPFAYMSEYIARGAARKILIDTGDAEQFSFYEPFFREQEDLVLRRTSRQNATTRTPTIYSSATQQNPSWWQGQW